MIKNLSEKNLEVLKKNGFIIVKKALDKDQVSVWKEKIYSLYNGQKYEINNTVGNVAFEKLLEIEPYLSRELIGHKSVAPYLKYFLGKQCQLRSLRAHINPGTYLQEWHMDFYDYWYQQESSKANVPLKGLCMNTTFYLTDNTPEKGRLRFLTEFLDKPTPEDLRIHAHYTDDRKNLFQTWCDGQKYIDLYPMAGDVIVFFSHIPHQGAKLVEDEEHSPRANIVLHYQQNPMFPDINFVSDPQFTLDQLGYAGTFPFK